MSAVHALEPRVRPPALQRIPRRPKAKSSVTESTKVSRKINNKKIITFRLQSPDVSNSKDKSDTAEPLDTRTFEFVTITNEPSKIDRNETSKKVRTQAMRDYLRKQNKEAITGVPEVVTSVILEEPSRYKGRFKLNTWSHKARMKATAARNAKKRGVEGRGATEEADGGEVAVSGHPISLLLLPNQVFSVNGRLDPFNSLSIQVELQDEKLLAHYNSVYRMNSVAVNAEGNFFSFVQTDSALFHSILYLVALHYDLKYGQKDSPSSLYHGGEAFRIINERLADPNGAFSDQTIGAVAMLVNKENLNGRYELSRFHMQGLEMMVRMRGGIQSLKGVFRRIVSWCDFCYSSVWDCQPLFPRIPPTSPPANALTKRSGVLNHDHIPENRLNTSHLFGSFSPIIPIFNSLRTLSSDLDPANYSSLDRLYASSMIYNVEYDLLLLNLNSIEPDPTGYPFSWETIPLKIAAHMYLWLVIRELPPTSELLYTVVQRLQDSLEAQLPGWWYWNWERKMWLLWIVFIGAVATDSRSERFWFVKELGKLCKELEVWDLERLREYLGRVVLQEIFFEFHLISIWDDVTLMWEVDGASPDMDGGMDLGIGQYQVPFSDGLQMGQMD